MSSARARILPTTRELEMQLMRVGKELARRRREGEGRPAGDGDQSEESGFDVGSGRQHEQLAMMYSKPDV